MSSAWLLPTAILRAITFASGAGSALVGSLFSGSAGFGPPAFATASAYFASTGTAGPGSTLRVALTGTVLGGRHCSVSRLQMSAL